MGSKVGTTALMPVFSIDNVIGSAGIFTSKTKGENGIALVADVSAYLGGFVQSNKLADHSRKVLQQAEQSDAPRALSPSRSQKKRIDRELYKMHRRNKRLSL